MKRLIALAGALSLMLTTLTGCGGGTVNGAADTTTTSTTYEMVLKLVDMNGYDLSTEQLSGLGEEQQIKAQAWLTKRTVTTTNGVQSGVTEGPAAGERITFSTEGAAISPAATVMTDTDGLAEVTLTMGDVPGSFPVTAQHEDSGVSESANYQIASILQPVLELSIEDAQGRKADTGNLVPGHNYYVRVRGYRIDSETGEMRSVSNVIVTVSTDAGLIDPSNGQVLLDENGTGRVVLQAGFESGAYQVSATADMDDETVSGTLAIRVSSPDVVMLPLAVGQPDSLSSGGTTSIGITLTDSAGNLWEPVTEIRLKSICSELGKAEISSPVLTVQGYVEASYRATGCVGVDVVTAEAVISGAALPVQQQAEINIAPADAGSIRFVEADPANIQIAGSGGVEVSTVRFQVFGVDGFPLPGAEVRLSIIGNRSVTIGEAGASSVNVLSDADGMVVANIYAGDVATTIRVMAEITDTGITTESGQIVVSTGIPDQNSFSLSFSTFTPEAWNYDGVEVEITARVADHFNNWAPDGTLVYFWAEGGSVEPQCATKDGACTVKWYSSNPRPEDGRVTVLARTVGQESFTDTNGNGIRDAGEAFDDLPEAWLDADEDGVRDDDEEFADFNTNGAYDLPNDAYDQSLDVRDSGIIVMASSNLVIEIVPDPIVVSDRTGRTVTVYVSDINGNMPPSGTKIEVSSTNGSIESNTTSVEVGTTTSPGPFAFSVYVIGDGEASRGVFEVLATTPNEVISHATAVLIDTVEDPCSFSPPAPECVQTPANLTANPADFTVVASTNTTESITLSVTDSNNQPVSGIQITGQCDATGTNDIAVSIASIAQTNSNGQATAQASVQTGPAPAGTVRCTFTVSDGNGGTIDTVVGFHP